MPSTINQVFSVKADIIQRKYTETFCGKSCQTHLKILISVFVLITHKINYNSRDS